MNRQALTAITAFFVFFLAVSSVSAEEFYCEVMSVEGVVTVSNATVSGKTLQEGDLLKVDDTIQVGQDASVDLAYDKDWNNVTRVEENSKIRLHSLFPTTVDLAEGAIFAKLKSLPRDSSFDVRTPTAIASVRGTEYRTTFTDGETEIYNVSNSDVYVYGVDESGEKQSDPVILQNSQKTQIVHAGERPVPARRMEERDFQPATRGRAAIEHKIQENVARGRVGKIQDIRAIEHFQEQRKMSEGGKSDVRQGGHSGQSEPRSFASGEGLAERKPQGNRDAEVGDHGRLGEPFFPGGDRGRHDGPGTSGEGLSVGQRDPTRGSLQGDHHPGSPSQGGQNQGGKPQGKQGGPRPAAARSHPR